MELNRMHMSVRARNERLFKALADMGLFVEAVPTPDNPDVIDYLIVSAGLPARFTQQGSQDASEAGVVPPVQGPLVAEDVGAAK